MNTKSVTRSVRFDEEFDALLERLSAERGMTVSSFIRSALLDVTERDARRRRLEDALAIAAELPDTNLDSEAQWGIGDRVPR
jgi:hypothetical protein